MLEEIKQRQVMAPSAFLNIFICSLFHTIKVFFAEFPDPNCSKSVRLLCDDLIKFVDEANNTGEHECRAHIH